MRRFLAAVAALMLVQTPLAAQNFDLSSDYVVIGEYSVEIDGEARNFFAVVNKGGGHSDLTYDTQSGIETYSMTAEGSTIAGEPEMPILVVDLQRGGPESALVIRSVTLVDETYQAILSASQGEYGVITYKDIVITEMGEVSFDFSADLVPVDMESEDPIPNKTGVHISGHFSGKIPASELGE